MIRAAITPGTQPHKVKSSTIKKDPQPFPITERGGKMMASSTRRKLMGNSIYQSIGHKSGYIVTPPGKKSLHNRKGLCKGGFIIEIYR